MLNQSKSERGSGDFLVIRVPRERSLHEFFVRHGYEFTGGRRHFDFLRLVVGFGIKIIMSRLLILAAACALLTGCVSPDDSNSAQTKDSAAENQKLSDQQTELLRKLAATVPAKTGNPGNNMLLALSPADRAAALAALVKEDNCSGTRAFYMGLWKKTGSGFWSVKCADGLAYLIEIKNDVAGSTNVLECSIVERDSSDRCFQRLKP